MPPTSSAAGRNGSASTSLAIVILGGLFTSTLLNLFVVPALYLRFGKRNRR